MKSDLTWWPRKWCGFVSGVLILATGCSAASPDEGSVAATSTAAASQSAAASTAASPGSGGTQVLDPGGLQAGTRYVMESLGISVQPDTEGWFAVLPQGGDVAMSREDVTVYFLVPDTVLAPDGTQVPTPADPQALLDAIDASAIATVTASEPFEANDISGLSAELEASGGSEAAPLMTTGSGALGLVDGEFQWIVFELGGRSLVVSIERSDAPDVAAAWEIAGPLVESLDVAE